MSTFRFAARRVLLTYSQCSDTLTKEGVFHTLEERYAMETYTLGEELHEDGGRHIHAAIEFKKKVNSRDVGLFDVNTGDQVHHPNIEIIKPGKAHFERATEYCCKEDDDPLTNYERTKRWDEILDEATDADEYLRLVRKNYPRDYALNYDRLVKMAAAHFPTHGPNTIDSFEPTTEMTMCEGLSSITLLPGRSTVVVGPAGCGKTTWAKDVAPKPCLFVRHLDSLSALRGNHRSIIFDDLDFRHLPPHAQKFLVDQENLAEIHVRYKVARIPPGIPRIFTANEYPFLEGGPHGAAIDRRVNKIYL